MNIEIEYKKGTTTDGHSPHWFKVRVTSLDHGGCSGPEMLEKIVTALVLGGEDATWVVQDGKTSVEHLKELPPPK